MPRRSERERIIEATYDAALHPERWCGTLRSLANLVGAREGLLFADDFRSPGALLLFATRPAGDPVLELFASGHRNNPWSAASLENPAGTVLRTEELVPRRTLMASDFYQECLKPLGLLHSLGGNIINEPGLLACFSFLRSPRRGAFGNGPVRLMRDLLVHLRQALRVQLRLADAPALERDALEALDLVTTGVLLVAADARVLFANAAASALLSRGHGITCLRGRLGAEDLEATCRLQAAVRAAASPARRGCDLMVRRDDAGWPLGLQVAPLGGQGVPAAGEPATVAVFVTDPRQPPSVQVSMLQQAFGLTGAEARVAKLLADGASLQQIASRLRVSVNTVRTHLARVFDKTGTARQAELVRLMTHLHPTASPLARCHPPARSPGGPAGPDSPDGPTAP
jgi:DNA-binding CsgD family transcriptional regulator